MLITGGIDFAKKRPVPYLITEGGFAAGAMVGAEIAEEEFPGQFLPRFGLETTTGMGGAISVQPIFPVTKILAGATKSIYNLFSKGRVTEKPIKELLTKPKVSLEKFRQRSGVKTFLGFLEKYGVDSEKFVKKLESSYMGMDQKFLDEFNIDIGSLDKLSKQSVGFKSGEPFAILYENSLMSNFDHLGPKRAEMFDKAQSAVLNIIKILKALVMTRL